MPKGNERDPFCADGINSFDGFERDPSGFKADGTGSSPKDGWGNDAATGPHFLDKAENKRPDRESKYSSEKTAIDRPSWPSEARVKKNSATAYEPDQWYRGPKEG
jgi:hypothetical protein